MGASREQRPGRVAPVLAVVFAALLADMVAHRAVEWLETHGGARAAAVVATELAARPDPGALVARLAPPGLARVVEDRASPDARYPFLPVLRYAAHPERAGEALRPESDADKAVADALRRAGTVFAVEGGHRAVAAVAGPGRAAAVVDLPRPDLGGALGRLRVALGLGGALGLGLWLWLLGRPARRRWQGPVGAAATLGLIGVGLAWAFAALLAAHSAWLQGLGGGLGLEGPLSAAQLEPRLRAQMGALLFAAPALPLVIAGVAGWITESRRSPHRAAYAYITPAMVGMAVLILAPFVFGLLLAFMRHSHGSFSFVGLRNFIQILRSEGVGFWEPLSFYFTLGVTVLWTALNVALHGTIGLALALVLKDPTLRFKGVYRVLLIVPWAVPNYITALIWKGMFNKQYGLINHLLGGLGVEPVSWFSGFWTAFAANVTTNTWLGFPFMMVVALGALQSIPQDLYEAADVDGASTFDKFRAITLPLLKPAMVPALILGSIWTFNMFNIIYLVSGGQPNGSTDILITEAYRWAFEQDRYGYAAAYSVLIFLILLGYSALTGRIARGAEATYG